MKKISIQVLIGLAIVVLIAILVIPPLFHLSDVWRILVGPDAFRAWLLGAEAALDWISDALRSLFPWPFVVLVIVFLFVGSKFTKQIEALARSLRSLEVFGTKIEFSQETQPVVFEQLEKVNEFIVLYRRQVRAALQEGMSSQELYTTFCRDVDACFQTLFADSMPGSYRATMHIEDFLFQNFLQQLFNYYPSGTGAGRAFSVRYGVIGKAWRSNRAYAAGRLLLGEMAERPTAEKREQISLDWAMTTAEAQRALEKPSYMCLPILHQGHTIALFYADSTVEDAFGINPDANRFQRIVQSRMEDSGLISKLTAFIDRYGRSAPRVELDLGKV